MDEMILKEIDDLIQQGDVIQNSLSTHDEWELDRDMERWEGSALNLLKLRFGNKSDYFLKFNECTFNGGLYGDYSENIRRSLGVLEFIRDALSKGLTEDLFYKNELIIFSDLLGQAFEFLDKKLSLAAGLYGRVVLETTIREFAKKNNICEKKFDQLIIKLRLSNIIQKPLENSLRSNYEIGSWAAHGDAKFQDLSDNEIKEYLVFIRDKVLTL